MSEQDKTPEVEVKKDLVSDTEPTISEVVGEKPKEEKKEVPETVPLSAFLEIKNSNKDLSRQIKQLQESIENGANKKEISSDIKAIAEKHNVDEDFLQSFADTIKLKAEAEIESKVDSRLKPFEEKSKTEKINSVFEEHYQKTLERMPEYKDIANKEVIKTLSLNPANANKTFSQIMEEAYGHLITGKRTMDIGTTGTGKKDLSDIDVVKASKDAEYFKQISSDPVAKQKYNEAMMERLKGVL